jgi:hypothetical protein
VPLGHLLACLAKNPGTNVANEPGLLENRNELVGRNWSLGRTLPSQECLDTNDREVLEIVNRLIDEVELVRSERRSQLELKHQSSTALSLHLGMEKLIAVLAARLGLVEGDVRIAQEFTADFTITQCDPDAYVDNQRHQGLMKFERLGHDIEVNRDGKVGERILGERGLLYVTCNEVLTRAA